MDGKSLAQFALTLVAVFMCGFVMLQKDDDTSELDQNTQAIAEANRDQIMALREEMQSLVKKLDRSQSKTSSIEAADLESLIAKAIARHNGEVLAEEKKEEVEEEVAVSQEQEFNFEAAMARMSANPDDWEGREALWEQLKKSGKLDEAIAWLEERVKNSPSNPEAHCDLAEGYLKKLEVPGNDMTAQGILAQKADAAFDRVLELDDQHWRGRLTKAIALSYWPAVSGKRGEAIKHFEILAEQHENQPPDKGHAWTHMFLGNMYSQQGKMEKARAAWKRGLAADPDNAELQRLMQSTGSGN